MKRALSNIIVILLSLSLSNHLFAQMLPDFTQLVEKTAPAIVNISTRSTFALDDSFSKPQDNQEFEEFLRLFGDRLPESFDGPERSSASLGSGFIISDNGYIVTNHHVIDGADEITITLNDQRQFEAQLIGSDERSDLALLRIIAEGLPTVPFGDIDDVKVGQWVLAIGSPFNLSHSVAAGIVSFVGRSLPQFNGQGNYVSFLQTDVAINPGHSGGPLFNLEGEVIGVNSQIFSNSGGSIGLSFAIPVDVAANVISQLMNTGNVARGWMGVAIANVTQDQADRFNLDTPSGAFVDRVVPGGPADGAGFQASDIILSYNGDSIRTSADLPYHVGLSMPGDEVEIEIVRNGQLQTINMVVGELDSASTQVQLQLTNLEPAQQRLGFRVSELSRQELDKLGLSHGLRIDQITGDVARQAGLLQGDLLLSLANVEMTSLDVFVEIALEHPFSAPTSALVDRDGEQSFFTLRISNQ
jgi:serine protease Do